MKIADLKPGAENITLRANVVQVEPPRKVATKYGENTLTVVQLDDGSGSIELSLWGDQGNGVTQGKTLEVSGAYVREFKGTLQLGVPRKGKVQVVS